MPKIPVKAARIAANLTQEEMANKLGITPSWYNTIENDPSKMSPYHYYAILYITGFKEDDVFSPKESSKN